MVRNGGAMTGYSTAVSVVSANWIARQLALFALYRPVHVFVADDNDGAVAWGSHGQLDVKVRWASTTDLIVTYPEKARVSSRVRKNSVRSVGGSRTTGIQLPPTD